MLITLRKLLLSLCDTITVMWWVINVATKLIRDSFNHLIFCHVIILFHSHIYNDVSIIDNDYSIYNNTMIILINCHMYNDVLTVIMILYSMCNINAIITCQVLLVVHWCEVTKEKIPPWVGRPCTQYAPASVWLIIITDYQSLYLYT